jgi:hypothetical protein
VLCPTTDLVPLLSTFTAQIIVFDIDYPILAGTAVELYHHSRDTPATISKLHAVLDKATGEIVKSNPRMLPGGISAKVTIQLRAPAVPLEPFNVNKGMGRILLRREGHTCVSIRFSKAITANLNLQDCGWNSSMIYYSLAPPVLPGHRERYRSEVCPNLHRAASLGSFPFERLFLYAKVL